MTGGKAYYIKESEANEITLRNLHLVERNDKVGLNKIVNDLIGIHSSRFKSPIFSLFCRKNFDSINSYFKNIYQNNELYRIRCMRGTLHILDFEDAIISHKATLNQRLKTCDYLIRKLDLTNNQIELLCNKILESLEKKPKNTYELLSDIYLGKKYISVFENKALKIGLRFLWEKGMLIRRNQSDHWETENSIYSINDNRIWFESLNEISTNYAEEILILKYFKSYGPATLEDAYWWSNINISRIKQIISKNSNTIIQVRISNCNRNYFIHSLAFDNRNKIELCNNVRLLAYEDNLLKGYKISRDRFVNQEHMNLVYNPAGEANASILVNGKIIGIWKHNLKNNTIHTIMFEKIKKTDNDLLKIEFERLKCLLDAKTEK